MIVARFPAAFCPLIALLVAAPALSDSGASATRAASDAFGETVGIDTVGLYSASQTRGFDLGAASAAFRIDGFYFQPAAAISESALQGSSVDVGIAATVLDLPSPTGVIAYRLREPAPDDRMEVTAGFRDGGPHLSAQLSLTDRGRGFSVVAHGMAEPRYVSVTGGTRPYVTGALIGRWQPDTGTRVTAFADYIGYWHDGDVSVLANGPGTPPPLPRFKRVGPSWSRTSYEGATFGLLGSHEWDRWSAGLSLIHSSLQRPRGDVGLLSIDRAGQVESTLLYTPPFSIRSNSGEAKIARTFSLFGTEHRFGFAVRARDTRTGRAQAVGVDTGRFALDDGPPDLPAPELPRTTARGSDRVLQRILSATYGLQWHDRLQFRLGVHASRYAKTVMDFGGGRARSVDNSRLFSASLIWQPAPRLRLFTSRVSGLEESGSAPSAAVNRGEVLPPVKARQSEIGARYELSRDLNLIVAGFDIRKPVYGLRADNLYVPIGTVRHRGIEASLTGRVGPGTTIVLGGNIVSPRLSGPLVDAGAVGRVAPGVSRLNGTLSIDQQFTKAWSMDAYLIYEGPRRRDQTGPTEVRGVPFAILGTRYNWSWGRTPITLRGQILNVLDRRGYYATAYGPLIPVSPIDYRLLLSASF